MSVRQTLPVREVLRGRRISWVDVVVGAGIIALLYTVVRLGQSMAVNFTPASPSAPASGHRSYGPSATPSGPPRTGTWERDSSLTCCAEGFQRTRRGNNSRSPSTGAAMASSSTSTPIRGSSHSMRFRLGPGVSTRRRRTDRAEH